MTQRFYKVFWLVLVFVSLKSFAQQDSLTSSIDFGFVGSSRSFLPLYSHSFTGGIFDYDFNGVYVRGASSGNLLSKKIKGLTYGVDLYMATQSTPIRAREGYLQYDYGQLAFVAGMREEVHKEFDELTINNFSVTNNARAFPKVGFFMDEYWSPSFLKGVISFKGSFFHGWLDQNRYIQSPWLHGKSAYANIQINKFSVYGGVNHLVVWGGTASEPNPEFKDNWTLSDFWKVIFSQGDDEAFSGERNALGNTVGHVDIGVTYKFSETTFVDLSLQTPFEGGAGSVIYNFRDNRDRGVSLKVDVSRAPIAGIKYFVLEYFSTKYQRGPGLPDPIPPDVDNFGFGFSGRQDFYNNWLYRDGWTYQDRVIGNPLFIDRALSQYYFGIIPDYEVAIVNNRIQAIHLGLIGSLNSINYKLLSTFSMNYGTYAGLYEGRFSWEGVWTNPDFEYVFKDPLFQSNFLLELTDTPFKQNENFELRMRMAADFGDISNNFGLEVAIAYKNFLSKKN